MCALSCLCLLSAVPRCRCIAVYACIHECVGVVCCVLCDVTVLFLCVGCRVRRVFCVCLCVIGCVCFVLSFLLLCILCIVSCDVWYAVYLCMSVVCCGVPRCRCVWLCASVSMCLGVWVCCVLCSRWFCVKCVCRMYYVYVLCMCMCVVHV